MKYIFLLGDILTILFIVSLIENQKIYKCENIKNESTGDLRVI